MYAKALLLLLALFLLLLPIATTDHSVDQTPTPTAESPAEVTPEVTPAPTVEVTAEVTPEPTLEPTAEVTTSPVVLVGDPVRGDLAFHEGFAPAPACINCHSTAYTGKQGFALGPGLKGIGAIAATRIEGVASEAYIEQSIRHPGAYLSGGFRDIMYPNFGTDYSDQTIADLIAYLMTL